MLWSIYFISGLSLEITVCYTAISIKYNDLSFYGCDQEAQTERWRGGGEPGKVKAGGGGRREQRVRMKKGGREIKSEIGRECWGRRSYRETVMDDIVSGDGGLF